MRATAFGYIRVPATSCTDAPREDAQLSLIQGFCNHHGLQLTGVFVDSADSADTPWLARPAGQELAARLAPGSHVVVAGGEWVYTTAADLLGVVQAWRQQKITLHIVAVKNRVQRAEYSITNLGASGDALISAMQGIRSLNRSCRSAAVKEGMHARKIEGKKYCRYAGYGYRWHGRKGHEHREPDEYEQGLMARIVKWKDAGVSWNDIAAHLFRSHVRTTAGHEWSPARVRRVYFAAVRLGLTIPGD